MSDVNKQQAMLAKVEALLAKAESTEFNEERESLVAKAQELMTKYAIEEAMLRKASDAADIQIDHVQINLSGIKYSKAVSLLIAAIANANNCHTVVTSKGWNQSTGKRERGYAHATIFGTPSSLDCVLMLVESLHRQMEIAIRETPVPEWEHGKTFRNNFVIAFANTIDRRLKASVQETIKNDTRAGVSLMLRDEAQMASQGAEEHFGHKLGAASGPSGRRSDAGTQAGREAGNRASLAKGQIG